MISSMKISLSSNHKWGIVWERGGVKEPKEKEREGKGRGLKIK
jgi:hypothetical protein